MGQRRLVPLIADTRLKQRFGGRNSFSTANELPRLINYPEISQNRDRITSGHTQMETTNCNKINGHNDG